MNRESHYGLDGDLDLGFEADFARVFDLLAAIVDLYRGGDLSK